MSHDLAKFLRGAEVRTLGRPMAVSLARVLVDVAALTGALALASSTLDPARAATPVARVDVVDHATPIRLSVTPRSAALHRASLVRVAATDLEAAALQAVMGDADRDVALASAPPPAPRPRVADAQSAAATALAGDAARDAAPVTYPLAPQVPAVRGRAVTSVVGEGGPKDLGDDPPPRSGIGVGYTAAPVLHEHVDRRGDLQVIEGGFTHRDTKGTQGSGLNSRGARIDPSIPDPSDAFMNVAVQTYMQNTTSSWQAAVDAVERMHALARSCVEDMGQMHDCSFGTAGIAFDYGQKRFTARLTPALVDGKTLNREGNVLVAYETPEGMYEGPAFHNVATAEPEAAPVPGR